MKVALAWFLLAFALAQEEHQKQPSHCSNAKEAKPPHKCDCKKTPGMGCDVEDNKCAVYCRPHKCFCVHKGCET